MWQLDHKESWAPKNWCFRTVVLEKIPQQSILKEISPDRSLEGLMLKLQYFGHLMRRTDSLEKTLMLGKIEGRRRRGWDGWMASLTWWTWVCVDSGSWWWTERPGVLQSMGPQRVGHSWATELNWDLHPSTSCFARMAPRAGPRKLVLRISGKVTAGWMYNRAIT